MSIICNSFLFDPKETALFRMWFLLHYDDTNRGSWLITPSAVDTNATLYVIFPHSIQKRSTRCIFNTNRIVFVGLTARAGVIPMQLLAKIKYEKWIVDIAVFGGPFLSDHRSGTGERFRRFLAR